ncbi:MAG: serine/threonine-protein kinase, partial [Planctomycetota bacterium]
MRREPGASPDAEPDGGASRGTSVQHAVEQFVDLHSSGQAPDIKTFAERFEADLRPQILAQCREFLSFDGLLGHQEWEPSTPQQTHGRTFGDFVIQEELGRGGMGIVYLATQRSLNRRVALKVMASGLTLSKRHVERFRREAAAAAQLRHPAIVPVHSLSEVDGTFALAMDFVAGRNLADILDDLRLANGDSPAAIEGSLGIEPSLGHVAECAMFCAQIASALAVAHEAGIVHRDLKPRNLMIDDRRQARLLDFGLAKSLGEGSISMSGEITGTAHYMSPEQTLAKRVVVDHRADIWALGVILYELVTLRRPFDGKNLQQIVYEICFKEPVSPHKLNAKVPRDLVTVCLKALEKDPQTRYQTAAEFEADLLRFLRWEPIHAKPAGALGRLGKWVRRHRTGTTIAAWVMAIVLTVLGVLWYQAVQDDHRASQYLLEAQQHADAGRFKEAIASVNQALLLRNDEATRSRLDLAYQQSKTAATQRQKDIAEAALRVARSNQAIDHDRELAIQLALAAVDLDPSSVSRSAVLEALGSGYRITTLRSADGALVHEGMVLSAHWSPDGKRIATTGGDGKVLLWDAANGTLSNTLVGHADRTWVSDPHFVANGDRLITGGADRTVRLWRTVDGSLLQTWAVPGAVSSLYIDRAGDRVLTAGYGSPTEGPWFAQTLDTKTGTALCPDVQHSQIIRAAALSPCGEYAASWAGEGHSVRLWRAGTGETIAPLTGFSDEVRAITFAPDSTLVATAAMDGGTRIYSVPEGKLVCTVWHSRPVDALTFDSDSARLLTGSRDQTARLWQLHRDVAAGTLTANEERTFVGHGGRVLQVAFDHSNALALTAGQDGVLRVFDAGGGRASTSMELLRYEVGPQIESATF